MTTLPRWIDSSTEEELVAIYDWMATDFFSIWDITPVPKGYNEKWGIRKLLNRLSKERDKIITPYHSFYNEFIRNNKLYFANDSYNLIEKIDGKFQKSIFGTPLFGRIKFKHFLFYKIITSGLYERASGDEKKDSPIQINLYSNILGIYLINYFHDFKRFLGLRDLGTFFICPEIKYWYNYYDDYKFSGNKSNHYCADFYVGYITKDKKELRKLIIECDGKDYHMNNNYSVERQYRRDRWFQKQGHKIFHYTGRQINNELVGVCREVFGETMTAYLRDNLQLII